MTDPFLVTGPALIAFSGGRTSAYMLWRILKAHGGKLPPDVVVTFQNTGKELEKTLRFVHECGARWSVPITWLEWRDNEQGYEIVGYNSASRAGEPFNALITKKGYLPNAVTRFCSLELKTLTAKLFAQRELGFGRWTNYIGLRDDEGHRILKALARNDANKEPFKAAMPLAKGKIVKRDVLTFWLGSTMVFPARELPQGFDLDLASYEGNCDGCFLKAFAKLARIERDRPGTMDWWAEAEAEVSDKTRKASGARFVTETSYLDVKRYVATTQEFDFGDPLDDERDTECGDQCEPETFEG